MLICAEQSGVFLSLRFGDITHSVHCDINFSRSLTLMCIPRISPKPNWHNQGANTAQTNDTDISLHLSLTVFVFFNSVHSLYNVMPFQISSSVSFYQTFSWTAINIKMFCLLENDFSKHKCSGARHCTK